MHQIIRNNVRCKIPEDKLKFTIYYHSNNVKSLIMKNNQAPPPSLLQQNNVIYEYNCIVNGCIEQPSQSYIG